MKQPNSPKEVQLAEIVRLTYEIQQVANRIEILHELGDVKDWRKRFAYEAINIAIQELAEYRVLV